jgi:uncharacterized protein YbjT (DUF2867 family)
MTDSYEYFSGNLPSEPKPELGKVLVTGATGYIGGRLVAELLHRGYDLRILVRAVSEENEERYPNTEIIAGDALDKESLVPALEGIHTAYYLIHSFLLDSDEFETADEIAARNFSEVASEQNVQKIIYLSGLGNFKSDLSAHLKSRIDVARIFLECEVPTTILRAAVIIGSGSASYEIIKHLVEKVPIMLMPLWSRTRCQPISVRDVIKYLVGFLEIDTSHNRMFDIGGTDILTYGQMLHVQALITGKKLRMLHIPLNLKRFYAYCVSLLTPVPGPITRCLMGSVMNEVICQEDDIKKLIPFETLSYQQSLEKALRIEAKDTVLTRWSDAYPPAFELARKLSEMNRVPEYASEYFLVSKQKKADLFKTICTIGGKEGWFYYNWMWRLRGYIDRIFLGVGSMRGRKNKDRLMVNDVVDFWRVEKIKQNKYLLLRAEMKLPGKAWLRFTIIDKSEECVVFVKAYFYVSNIWGRLYWLTFLPFHYFIFKSLLKQIDLRSVNPTSATTVSTA